MPFVCVPISDHPFVRWLLVRYLALLSLYLSRYWDCFRVPLPRTLKSNRLVLDLQNSNYKNAMSLCAFDEFNRWIECICYHTHLHFVFPGVLLVSWDWEEIQTRAPFLLLMARMLDSMDSPFYTLFFQFNDTRNCLFCIQIEHRLNMFLFFLVIIVDQTHSLPILSFDHNNFWRLDISLRSTLGEAYTVITKLCSLQFSQQIAGLSIV